MAPILQLVLSIQKSIYEALSYIFKMVLKMITQYIVHKLISLTNRKPQITLSCEGETNCQNPSMTEQKIEKPGSRLDNDRPKYLETDEDKNPTKPTSSDHKKYKSIQNKLTTLQHQQNCIGDNCIPFQPVMSDLDPVAELKKQSSVLSGGEVNNKNRLKVHTVSKYTLSFMEDLSTKSDHILRLLDELSDMSPMDSEKYLLKETTLQDSTEESQRCLEGNKIKIQSMVWVKPPEETQVEGNVKDDCDCIYTHHCLFEDDSEDDNDDFEWSDILGFDADEEDKLLTSVELASVETGSDEDWLYKFMPNKLVES